MPAILLLFVRESGRPRIFSTAEFHPVHTDDRQRPQGPRQIPLSETRPASALPPLRPSLHRASIARHPQRSRSQARGLARPPLLPPPPLSRPFPPLPTSPPLVPPP